MHMFACCGFCYQTYLTPQGELIEEKIEALVRRSYLAFISDEISKKKKEDQAFLQSHLEMLKNADFEVLEETYKAYMDEHMKNKKEKEKR